MTHQLHTLHVIMGPNQVKILQCVADTPGLNNNEIQEQTNIKGTKTIYKLRSKGLIYNKRARTKHAPSLWYPTEPGRELLHNIESGTFDRHSTLKSAIKAASTVETPVPPPVIPPPALLTPKPAPMCVGGVHFVPTTPGQECPRCGVYIPQQFAFPNEG